MLVQIGFLLLIWSSPFSLKGNRRRLSIFFLEITAKIQQTISCVMLPFAGRNIDLPRKLKGPRHVFLLHNGIRGVTCSSTQMNSWRRPKKKPDDLHEHEDECFYYNLYTASGVFPLGFVFLISQPKLLPLHAFLSFTAKRKRRFIPHLYSVPYLQLYWRHSRSVQNSSNWSFHFNFPNIIV